jgi:hypothetical protein
MEIGTFLGYPPVFVRVGVAAAELDWPKPLRRFSVALPTKRNVWLTECAQQPYCLWL